MFIKKIVLSFFLCVVLLLPNLVLAKTVIPDFNPICWTRDECIDARKQMFEFAVAEDGFFPNEGGCTGVIEGANVWGKCAPGTSAKTEISIGGKTRFANIGEYIETVYYYALGIAGIVAVIVIIVAGIQWIVAAGNTAVIGAAKKRIGGALIGLFIAYSSFFILNSINPWLTQFRLPQTWMIKEISMMTEFCIDIQSIDKAPGVNFALVKDPDEGIDKKIEDLKSEDFVPELLVLKNKKENKVKNGSGLGCYQSFVPKGGANALCQGNYCEDGGLCLKSELDTKTGEWDYFCEDTVMGGRVFGKYLLEPSCSPFTEGFTKPFITDGSELLLVCKDNSVHKIADIDVYDIPGSKNSNLWLVGGLKASSVDSKIQSGCGGIEKYRGFILKLFLDEACDGTDEIHIVGANGKDMGVISRTKDIAIGAAAGSVFAGPVGTIVGAAVAYFSTAGEISELKGTFNDSYFVTRDQLVNGYRLNINTANIPDID